MVNIDRAACGSPHAKRTAKLLTDIGKAKAGTVVEVEVCPVCGVWVKSKAIGIQDEGAWMVPSELAKLEAPRKP